ncbi:tetratricopeptide repeat protein [Asanoa sp. WMMD1127]|uniref:TPR end-of-group domain-containing protein n=1 Tax=Asanoa sp. WMMD1127 TaxID=3016107 RepID=UPI00241690D0|nr:tetratricopeptide repeat protein [Asanoa sp. WMMD1127]MDG4826911.1 tetratricopeptide repeat protein [Asanoa sp. WMMD1127]
MDDVAEQLRVVAAAQARAGDQDWAAAVDLWRRVVSANPVNGNHWLGLATAAFEAGDLARALTAYERVAELGAWDGPGTPLPADIWKRIAQCRARTGDVEGAFDALREALDRGLRDRDGLATDEHLAALRDDDRWPALVVPPAAGWPEDLSFFAHEVKRRSRASVPPDFDAAVAKLATANDAQMLVELSRLVATLADGHARVEPPADRHDLHMAVPIKVEHFVEGLFVTAAAPEHHGILGAQVVALDGVGVDEAIKRMGEIVARDNPQGALAGITRKLPRTTLLHALGIARSPDELTLTLHQRQDVTLRASPIGKADSDARPCPPGWRWLPALQSSPLPLHLRNVQSAHWHERQDDGLVYAQINTMVEPLDELAALFETRPGRLVLDLRWNEGGNTFHTMPLLHKLIAYDGELFVVIGRHTLSAAQNFATFLADHTDAVFVGEPTGSRPNFVGETAPFTLPHSRFEVNVSDLYWQSSWPMDHRIWIAPDIYAPPTFEAYAANRDPALEAVRAVPPMGG